MIALRKITNFSYVVSFINIIIFAAFFILGFTYFSLASVKDQYKRVQTYLKILNYDVGSVDGVIGSKTIKVLQSALKENITPKDVKANVTHFNSRLIQLYLRKMFEKSKFIPHLQKKMGISDARHLLERVGIGAPPEQVARIINMTRGQAIYALLSNLNDCKVAADPIALGKDITPYLLRNSQSPRESIFRFRRNEELANLKSWWIREMILTKCPQKERLTLFWTNHFSVQYSAINELAMMLYNKHFMLRLYGFGNFKVLVKNIIKEPAMIVYLDNQWNSRFAPNENLARELMELFVLGEGTYSEETVKEAARTLTGFTFNRFTDYKFQIDDWSRDKGKKNLFGEKGYYNGFNLVDILFSQPSASTFITRKFWKYYVSNTDVNEEEILKISNLFRDSNFEIPVLLNEILSSKSFWNTSYRGTIIKSPVDLVIGSIRSTGMNYLDEHFIASELELLGQNIFEPPNVAGWPGGEAWVTPSLYLSRVEFLKGFTSSDFIMEDKKIETSNMMSYSKKSVNDDRMVSKAKEVINSKKYKNFYYYFYDTNPIKNDQLLIGHVNVVHTKSFNEKTRWREIMINLNGVRFNKNTQNVLQIRLTHDRKENNIHFWIQKRNCSNNCLSNRFPPKNKQQDVRIFLPKNEPNWGRDQFYGLSAKDKKFVSALWQAFPAIWDEVGKDPASSIGPLKSWKKKISEIKKELKKSRYVKEYNLKKVKISNDFIDEMMKFDAVTQEEREEINRRSEEFLLLSNYNKDLPGFELLSKKILGTNSIKSLLLSTAPLTEVTELNLGRDYNNNISLSFLTEEVYNSALGYMSLYDNQGNFNGLVAFYDNINTLKKDLNARQKEYEVPNSNLTLSNITETSTNIDLEGIAISKSFGDDTELATEFAVISTWRPKGKISLKKLINDPVFQVK